jgi:hypothetical protein
MSESRALAPDRTGSHLRLSISIPLVVNGQSQIEI